MPVPHNTKQLYILFGSVTLYAFCYQMQSPVIPYLLKNLGHESADQYARFQSFFNLVQLIGTVVSGPLKDRTSARTLLLISFACSLACYALTACANSLPLLYLSRLPGVMQHGVLAARTLVADLTDDSTRALYMGRVSVAYSIGAVLGPATGGLLKDLAPAFSAFGSVVCALIAWQWIEEIRYDHGKKHARDADAGNSQQSQQGTTKSALLELYDLVRSNAGLRRALVRRIFAGLGHPLMMSTFSITLAQHFKIETEVTGYVMSYMAVCLGTSNAFLVKPFTARFTEDQIMKIAAFGIAVAYGLYSQAHTITSLLAVLPLISLFGSLMSVVLSSYSVRQVDKKDAGKVVALDMTIGSSQGIVCPIVCGYVLTQYGFPTFAAGCGLFYLAVFVALYFFESERARARQAADDSAKKTE